MNLNLNLIYRDGSIADRDQLRELALKSYLQFKESLSNENWNTFYSLLDSLDTYEDILKIAKCFLCMNDKEIVGVAYIVPRGNPTELFLNDWCYIRMVAVNPEFRGRGIARQLTQMCIDYAINSGEKTIALHTSEFMNTARHIYESIGFKPTKEMLLFGKKYWLYQLALT